MGASLGFSQSGSSSTPVQTVQGNAYNGLALANQLATTNTNDLYNKILNAIPSYTTAASGAAQQAGNQASANQAQQGSNLFNTYGTALNNTQQQMGASNLQSNANAIGNTLTSSAIGQIGSGFMQGQQSINPSYGTSMSGLQQMMNSASPNGFTGSQLAQIGRGLAQMNYQGGNSSVLSPLTSLNNAMTFGTGLQSMQNQYANLASSAANTANTLNGGQNIFGMATAQPTGTASPNTGTTPSQFLQMPQSNYANALGISTQTPSIFGTNLFGTQAGLLSSGNQAAAGQQEAQSESYGVNAGAGANSMFGSYG